MSSVNCLEYHIVSPMVVGTGPRVRPFDLYMRGVSYRLVEHVSEVMHCSTLSVRCLLSVRVRILCRPTICSIINLNSSPSMHNLFHPLLCENLHHPHRLNLCITSRRISDYSGFIVMRKNLPIVYCDTASSNHCPLQTLFQNSIAVLPTWKMWLEV
jgi:hypothetical protein